MQDIDLPKKATEIGTIRRMFLDPTASHLIITTSLGENYYLHTQSRTPKSLSRLKGVSIECVAWNPSQPTASTREMLIGAADGNIYETFLELSTELFRREEKYVKNVYKTEAPVCGIWTDTLPGRADLRRVLIATTGRLLHFLGKTGRQGHEGGGSIYSRLFETENPAIHEVGPSAGVAPSVLAVTPESPDTPGMEGSRPERIFAWICSQGILHGKLLVSPASPELGDKVLKECQWHSVPTSNKSRPRGLFLALSQWHILHLVENRVVAINRLDDSVVYDQIILDKGQRPLALLADLKKNTFWLFTTQAIYEVEVQDEDRDIWKIMMKQQRFEEALQYTNNSAQTDAVATASGDHLLEKNQYLEAASVYGKSTKSFEEVSLAFIDKAQRDALRKYLLTKLSTLKKTSVMQRIMLTSWIVELFMTKLDSLDDMITTKAELTEHETPADVKNQLSSVRQEYQSFVRRYRDDIDKKVAYETMSSHGREDELLFFATVINDSGYVLSYWIQRENWDEALNALNKRPDEEIIYKYGSVLMTHAATPFVDILLRQDDLDARRLVPACLNYDETAKAPLAQNQAVRYLLFEINQRNSLDTAIHNTLLSIYASHPSPDETALVNYLESQSPTSLPPPASSTNPTGRASTLPYDADFALRLCIKHHRVRACAHIYTTMGQYVSAVELALRHGDTSIATSVAERPEHDLPTRKKLWLAIAKSVIAGETPSSSLPPLPSTPTGKDPSPSSTPNPPQTTQPKGLAPARGKAAAAAQDQGASIKTALSLLRRAPPGVLRIEDLLPLFPDFVLVDTFKSEICAALESYSAQIESLRREMDDSAATAARIASEEAGLSRRWVLLEPGEGCGVCGEVLLDRRFWVWGCGHGVHADCLMRELVRYGGRGVARRVREVRAALETEREGRRREGLVAEMDEVLGGKCPLCGELGVKMVEEPFVAEGEEEEEDGKAWAL